ncbi:alpha/beta fold hydrolase [Actinomadura sp. LD22]|uniref:Alpha/beta fold hydrolase n=1 Tax=Actinomadura physcomitrii TaxID=2650748 RepID=A0A6I4MBI1_9ACTN|nr:alpha/beta fold hydrolase [Actinomadura physcomitrii]MWA01594.1 alpha/beta fold hydrolase [Actinomadura physcomitrii]
MAGTQSPTLVLIHGAWHGSWCWEPVVPLLEAAGLRTHAVQLPGMDRAPGHHDLEGHAAFLRAELAELPGPLAVCAHSYGGAVATEAAGANPSVATLIYLTAFLLDVGESCVDRVLPGPVSPDATLLPGGEGGYLRVPEAAAHHLLYGDCPPEEAKRAAARLTPEHVSAVSAPVTQAAWRTIPSTYVTCTRDQALTPEVQGRMACRATWQEEIASGHSPMLSHPQELAALLATAAVRTARDA